MKTLSWSTRDQARQWVRSFSANLRRPCVVLLSGDLGAGKTQLVKWFLEDMKMNEAASPTFAIHQQYETAAGSVDHVDLYRLQSDSDLESSGFWDLLTQERGLVFVEWADRLPTSVWPRNWTRISLHLRKGETEEARQLDLTLTKPQT